jgi:hypothetical protein
MAAEKSSDASKAKKILPSIFKPKLQNPKKKLTSAVLLLTVLLVLGHPMKGLHPPLDLLEPRSAILPAREQKNK